LKIVQVNPHFLPSKGGSEWFCSNLSKRLAERGHEVHVLSSTFGSKEASFQVRDGYFVSRHPYVGVVGKTNPATFILHKLLAMKADVIHAHSYIFLTSNQAALARKLGTTPFILHLHGGLEFAPVAGDPLSRVLFLMKRLYDPTLGKWTVRAADVVGSVSKKDLEIARRLWKIEPDKLCWLPNAVDTDKFYPDQRQEKRNVVFIGRLERWKGVHIFLEVARRISRERRSLNFLVVGDGSLRRLAESLAEQSCNGRVKFLGEIAHDEIAAVLAQAAILVLPSFVEGLPTVCLEALASGVPVVASDVGGVSEVVVDGQTGFLFPAGNVKECFDKVENLLSDEQLRNRMGREGRRLVKSLYTWEKAVTAVEEVYEAIAA